MRFSARFLDSSYAAAVYLAHQRVRGVISENGGWLKKTKRVVVSLHGTPRVCRLEFETDGRDKVLQRYEEALQGRAWEKKRPKTEVYRADGPVSRAMQLQGRLFYCPAGHAPDGARPAGQ